MIQYSSDWESCKVLTINALKISFMRQTNRQIAALGAPTEYRCLEKNGSAVQLCLFGASH